MGFDFNVLNPSPVSLDVFSLEEIYNEVDKRESLGVFRFSSVTHSSLVHTGAEDVQEFGLSWDGTNVTIL